MAFGFGGGTMLLGLLSSFSVGFSRAALWAAFRGYFLAALPFFVAALVLDRCKREFWFVPSARSFRMLTFRPWQLSGPRVEEARLDDFRAVKTERLELETEQAASVVSLVMTAGDSVPVREFDAPEEANVLAEELARRTGLPLFSEREVEPSTT